MITESALKKNMLNASLKYFNVFTVNMNIRVPE